MHFRREYVRCGKARCRCNSGAAHGPYWYGYYWEKGRLRKRYFGKARPVGGTWEDDAQEGPYVPKGAGRAPERWEWDGRRMTHATAYRILGISRAGDARAAWVKLCKAWHPDVCRDPEATRVMKAVNVAYETLQH